MDGEENANAASVWSVDCEWTVCSVKANGEKIENGDSVDTAREDCKRVDSSDDFDFSFLDDVLLGKILLRLRLLSFRSDFRASP